MEVWTKSILYLFIEGQTYFGMPRASKMSLALYKPTQVALHSNSKKQKLPPSTRLKLKEIIDIVCKTTNRKSLGTKLPTKSHIE